MDSELDRSFEAKVERLRTRLKNANIDPALRAILLGFLDLLEDEL